MTNFKLTFRTSMWYHLSFATSSNPSISLANSCNSHSQMKHALITANIKKVKFSKHIQLSRKRLYICWVPRNHFLHQRIHWNLDHSLCSPPLHVWIILCYSHLYQQKSQNMGVYLDCFIGQYHSITEPEYAKSTATEQLSSQHRYFCEYLTEYFCYTVQGNME